MPRGPLPSLPFAGVVLSWPTWLDFGLAVAVGALSRRAHARGAALSEFSEEIVFEDRIELALVLFAVFQGIGVGARLVPLILANDPV